MKNELQKGDTIKCHDAEELVKIMTELELLGYKTDFLFEVKGVPGKYLEIKDIPRRKKRCKTLI